MPGGSQVGLQAGDGPAQIRIGGRGIAGGGQRGVGLTERSLEISNLAGEIRIGGSGVARGGERGLKLGDFASEIRVRGGGIAGGGERGLELAHAVGQVGVAGRGGLAAGGLGFEGGDLGAELVGFGAGGVHLAAQRCLVGLKHLQVGQKGGALALGGHGGALVVVELPCEVGAGLLGGAEFLDRGGHGGFQLAHAAGQVGVGRGGGFGILGRDQLAAAVGERGFQLGDATREVGIGGGGGFGGEPSLEFGNLAGEVRILRRGVLFLEIGDPSLERGCGGVAGVELVGTVLELGAGQGEFSGRGGGLSL